MKKHFFILLVGVLLFSSVAVKGFADNRLLANIEVFGEYYERLVLIDSNEIAYSYPISVYNIMKSNNRIFIAPRSEYTSSCAVYQLIGRDLKKLIEYCDLNQLAFPSLYEEGFGLVPLSGTNDILLIFGGMTVNLQVVILHKHIATPGGHSINRADIFSLENAYFEGQIPYSEYTISGIATDSSNNLFLFHMIYEGGIYFWRILKVTPEGEQTVVDSGELNTGEYLAPDSLVINANGDIYFGINAAWNTGTVWRIPNGGMREIVATGTELIQLEHFTLDTTGNLFATRYNNGNNRREIIKIDTTTGGVALIMSGLSEVMDLLALD